MAIIQGMRPAEMGDVKPFELPIDDMAKGVMAVQGRADEVKNTIALGDSALKIETRNIQEDMDLSNQISSEYKSEWEKMLVDAGGDYSKIDNSQIQSLATKYASDDRVRYLTSAKKHQDAMLDIQKKIQVNGGEALFFGPVDPNKMSLKDETGAWRNMGDYDLEGQLDYSKKAQSLFLNIGHELTEASGYDPTVHGNFYDFIVNRHTSDKDNIDEIDYIINNGQQMFKDSTEGIQFVKLKKQQLLKDNPNQSEEELNKTVDKYIFDMMMGIGKSQQIVERKLKLTDQVIMKPEPPVRKNTTGGTNGKGDPIVTVNQGDTPMTYSGMSLGGPNNTPRQAAINIESENYQIDNFRELADNYNSVNNINALKDVALRVSNGGGGGEYGDKAYNPGVLYQLDANLSGSSFTGDANRTVIRIMNPDLKNGKTSEDIFNEKNKENLIVDFDDLKAIHPEKTAVQLKQMIFGSSKMDGFMNLLDINEKDAEGTVDIGVNQTFLKLKTHLEEKVAKGDKFAQIKLDRLNKKLKDSEEYMSVHGEDITKLKAKFYTLKQTANQYKRIDKEAATKAGLDSKFIEKQEEFYKRDGKSGTYLGDVSDIFDNASLNAINNYMDSWQTRRTHGNPNEASYVNYHNTPEWLFKKIGGTEEQGKFMLTGSPEGRKGYDLYMGILQDFLDQDVNMSEVMTVVYNNPRANLGSMNGDPQERNYILFKDYAKRKLNQIKDLDPKIKDHLVNAIAGVAGQFANVQQDKQGGPVTLQYAAGKSPTEIKEVLAKNRSDEFTRIATAKKTTVSGQVLNYLNNIKELKEEYILEKQKMWLIGGDSDASGWGDALVRLRAQLKSAVDSPSTLIKRVRWNKSGTNGNPTLSEEYNAADFKKIMDLYLYDENGNIKQGGEDAFYKDVFKGLTFDYDNPNKPFSAILSVSPKKGDQKIDLEIEISPDPLDLMMFGVQPLQYRYYNDIKKGMKESDNSYFDLDFNGNKTRFFRAPYNLDGINKGEFYTIGSGDPSDINNPNSKKQKIGTSDAAIVYHTERVTKGINMGYVDQLKEIISDYKKNPKSLVDKWNFKDGTKISDIENALNKHITDNSGNTTENEGK